MHGPGLPRPPGGHCLRPARCTIVLRWHTTPDDDDEDELDVLRGYTADADVDLSALGPGRALLDNVEEKGDLFWQAYELAGR